MDYAEILKDKDKYRAEMSAEERMSVYRSGEEVDHQPYALMSSNFAVANVLRYTASDVRNNFDVNCQVIDFMQNELGIETLNVGLGLRSLGQAMGSTLHYPKNDVDSIEKYSIAGFKEIECLCEIDPNNNNVFTSKIESGKKLKEKFPKLTVTTSVAGPFTSAISIMPAETFLKGTIKLKPST